MPATGPDFTEGRFALPSWRGLETGLEVGGHRRDLVLGQGRERGHDAVVALAEDGDLALEAVDDHVGDVVGVVDGRVVEQGRELAGQAGAARLMAGRADLGIDLLTLAEQLGLGRIGLGCRVGFSLGLGLGCGAGRCHEWSEKGHERGQQGGGQRRSAEGRESWPGGGKWSGSAQAPCGAST